jgi:hypothetical protein
MRRPRSRVQLIAIPGADGCEKLAAPACELADAASGIAGRSVHTLRIKIEVVGMTEEVPNSFQFPDGASRKSTQTCPGHAGRAPPATARACVRPMPHRVAPSLDGAQPEATCPKHKLRRSCGVFSPGKLATYARKCRRHRSRGVRRLHQRGQQSGQRDDHRRPPSPTTPASPIR